MSSSRPITVTLNHNHSKKFVFLLPLELPAKDRILQESKNKFRIKAISTVFLRGGALLGDDEPLPDFVTQVWVSKGEPYNGPPANTSRPIRSGTAGEVRVIATKSYVDENAVKQLRYVAGLPGVQLAVGMPDLHPGSRFPIGCAVASEGIYPALIGSDVGCGISFYKLAERSKLQLNPKKIATLLVGLDEPWAGSASEWLAKYGVSRTSSFDQESLGSVGAGNHFAEICTVEEIVDEAGAKQLGILDNGLYLMVHTGSRGLGASILARETTESSNPYIPPDSPYIDSYLAEHDYAVKWAIANRDLVAYRIKQCLFSPMDSISSTASLSELEKILDVTHNSVSRHIMTFGDSSKEMWVHRKGAAPTDRGITPCPGSRGDYSWLLQPTGDGQYNAHSLAHGAGRRFPRNVLHTGQRRTKSSLTTTSLGSEVICTDPDLLLEEQPEAYKDVGCVVDDMEEQHMCKRVMAIRPIVTYKVREGGQRRA